MIQLPDKTKFSECLNQKFQVKSGKTVVEMELIEVIDLGKKMNVPDNIRKEPFSLVFRAPKNSGFWQGMYNITNDNIGSHNICLVPIAPDIKGDNFEAVFN